MDFSKGGESKGLIAGLDGLLGRPRFSEGVSTKIEFGATRHLLIVNN
jgi:hypothetical protein